MSSPSSAPIPEGALNFRDVGGLPTADGGRTATGAVFRSDALDHLTERGVAALSELGVRRVVDLRWAIETDGQLPPWAEGTEIAFTSFPLGRLADPDEPLGDLKTLQARRYLSYLEASSDSVVSLLRSLAEPAGTPTIVHCAHGKDRTGTVIAILLGVLGVTPEAIVADYVASGENLEAVLARTEEAKPFYRERRAVNPVELYLADAPTMERFLEGVDALGGAVDWALSRGLGEDALERLRRRLVTRPSDA